MGISLNPDHLKRYKDIAALFLKYGRSDLVNKVGLEDALDPESQADTPDGEPKAEELAKDLENMGPLFIKMGQVLSSRSDLLPLPYIQALSRLQDSLEPFSFAEVEKIVEEQLGVRMSKAFAEFESTPMASASLGQVHRARLRDGRRVAVKIQRPGIREQISMDLEAMNEIAKFADEHTEIGDRYHFTELLEEFRKNLARELDYHQEAQNLKTLWENLKSYETIVVPYPVDDYTTGTVLTMDYIQGKKITKVGPLGQMELDGHRLAEDMFKAYLQQTLVDGFFHADPHPGNVFITDDGRIALIDLGMIGRVSPDLQEQLLKLLLAMADGQSDTAADLAMHIGEIRPEYFNEQTFRRKVAEIVSKQQGATVENYKVGLVMMEYSQVAGESGIRMPAELTMLSKMLLNLDEVGRILDPGFDPNDSIRRNASEITRKRMLKSVSPSNIFAAAMEAKEFAQTFPSRINRILEMLTKNQLKVSVDAIDEVTLVDGFEKISNRITMGLILASLIIGAALLMRVETDFRLFGYPGLAIVCFLLAASGGVYLVISIMKQDRESRKKAKLPAH